MNYNSNKTIKVFLHICVCGHTKDKHVLHLETYSVCEVCHEAGLLRAGFIHDFKLDNLRSLEETARED